MKKKITLIAFAMLAAHGLWAQECDPTPFYEEDFEFVTVPELPECSTVLTPDDATGWVTVNNPGSGFENNALHYAGGEDAADAWFFSHGVELQANTYYKISYKYGNNNADTTESLVFTRGLAADAESAEIISTHAAITGGTPANQSIELFMNAVEGTYYFGFHATSEGGEGSLYVDDIVIEETVCGTPSNVQVTDISQTGATISWGTTTGSNISAFSVYQYAIEETNTPPADGTYHGETSISMTTLEPGNTYFAFTRSLCGLVWGDWTEAVEFTTPTCDAGTIPYYQDFETATVPNAPECTVITGSGNNWVTVNNPGSGFETNALHYEGNDEAAATWFFTQGIQMTQGINYKITYTYGNDSADTTESLKVIVATSPNSASQSFLLNEITEITGGSSTVYTSSITGVPADGVYYVGFSANSGAGQGSLFIDNIEVEEWDCGVPQEITLSGITSTSATVTWEAPEEATSFGYLVYFGTNDGTPENDGTYVNGLTHDRTGLEPGTTYYVFAKSQCGPLMGEWSEPIAFTTPACEPATIPYYQDFETATVPDAPECTVITESGNNWVTVNNPGSGFETNALHYEGNDEAAATWFFTQGIQMTQGTNYKITYTYGNDSADTTESLKVIVATSPNAASQSFLLNEITEITGGSSTVYTSSITGVPADGVYYVGFNANSETGQGSLFIDNIEVEEWDCGVPQEITLSGITSTSATVTWEAPEEATSFGYLIYFGTNNGTPENDGVYVNGLTQERTDLAPGTTYYVFAKSQCGPLMGEWAEPLSFTTPACEPSAVPYSLDFESAVVPGVPECTIAHEAATGNDWVTVNNPGSGFENSTLHYAGSDEAADAWFYTNGIELTPGTLYKISYKYGNSNATTTESLKVTLNSNPNPEWATGVFADHAAVTGGAPLENAGEYFNVPEEGVYYFGFNAYSAAGTGSIYVDDFLVEEMQCGTPSDVLVANITDSSADVTWSAPDSGNSTPTLYQYAVGETDTPPAEGTFDNDLSVSLDELEPETTYYVFTRTQCGPLWSDWTVTSFITEATAGLGDHAFSGFTFYPNPVKDIVTLTNTSLIDTVTVYNVTGQLVHRQSVGAERGEISLQKLSAGAYIMNVQAGSELKRVKIIKE